MKRALADYYMGRVMPETGALLAKVKAGAAPLMAPAAAMF